MHFNKGTHFWCLHNWIIYINDHIQSGHIFEAKQKYGNKREKHDGKAQDSASRQVYSYNSFYHDTNKTPSRSSHGLFVGSHQPINTQCTPPPYHATTLDNCSISSDKLSIDFCDKKQHLDPEFSCVSCSLVELTKDILSKGIMLDEEVVSAPSYLSSRHGINIVFPLDVILASDLYCWELFLFIKKV